MYAHVFLSCACSGSHSYFYSKKTHEWIDTIDHHSFEGIFVRDLIRHVGLVVWCCFVCVFIYCLFDFVMYTGFDQAFSLMYSPLAALLYYSHAMQSSTINNPYNKFPKSNKPPNLQITAPVSRSSQALVRTITRRQNTKNGINHNGFAVLVDISHTAFVGVWRQWIARWWQMWHS